MSKKGGKSTPSGKNDKEKRTTPSNEIIPGIVDTEWNLFQEIEQRDVLISGVVGDIIDESLDQILERHTDRIAIDCAVRDVMGILSDAIRVNFITHDSENFNIDFDSHDLAPPPTQTDSWARGRIPVVHKNTIKESQSRVSTSINVRFNSAKSTERSIMPSGMGNLPDISTNEAPVPPAIRCGNVIPITNTSASTNIIDQKQRKNFKRYTGRVQSGALKSITTPLDQAEESLLKSRLQPKKKENATGAPASFNTIWKVMQNRPSNKDLVQFDEDGNVKSITKLSNRALPKLQKSRPDVKITDTEIIKGPTLMKDKSRQYRVASLRPVSGTTNLRQNPTLELSHGVTMLQAGDKPRPSRSSSDKQLRPMKLMQSAPLDHKAIVQEATY